MIIFFAFYNFFLLKSRSKEFFKIELGARYEGWSGDRKDNSLIVPVKSFVGLRLAFNFGI